MPMMDECFMQVKGFSYSLSALLGALPQLSGTLSMILSLFVFFVK